MRFALRSVRLPGGLWNPAEADLTRCFLSVRGIAEVFKQISIGSGHKLWHHRVEDRSGSAVIACRGQSESYELNQWASELHNDNKRNYRDRQADAKTIATSSQSFATCNNNETQEDKDNL